MKKIKLEMWPSGMLMPTKESYQQILDEQNEHFKKLYAQKLRDIELTIAKMKVKH